MVRSAAESALAHARNLCSFFQPVVTVVLESAALLVIWDLLALVSASLCLGRPHSLTNVMQALYLSKSNGQFPLVDAVCCFT
jgi:hypothetical protein